MRKHNLFLDTGGCILKVISRTEPGTVAIEMKHDSCKDDAKGSARDSGKAFQFETYNVRS